jgi:general secretion pathway protein G
MLHNHLEALRKARKGEGGFTLIELLIVIVILGVLAGIVVFSVRGISDRGDTAACKSNLKATEVAVEAYYAKNGSNPGSTAVLVPDFLKSDPGAAPVPANQRVTYNSGTGAVTGGSAC